MADDYRTDDEQIEAIKSWWQENGTSTVMTVVLAVGSVFGWQQWQQSQQADREQASLQYQELLDAAGQAEQSASLRSTAEHLAGELKDNHASSTYAYFAALHMAKLHVEDNKLAEAKVQLQWIVDNRAPDPAITSLARLRLARVVFAESGPQEALGIIDNVEAGVYQAAYAELRGDLFDELGELEKAQQQYSSAREGAGANGANANSLLEMKYKSVVRRVAATDSASTPSSTASSAPSSTPSSTGEKTEEMQEAADELLSEEVLSEKVLSGKVVEQGTELPEASSNTETEENQ